MKAKKLFVVLLVFTLLVTACQTAAPTEAPADVVATEALAVVATEAAAPSGAPAVCDTDAFGCAVFEPGDVLKIGMGAPMTGGDASYGIDISQGSSD